MNAAEITDKLGLHSLRQRAWVGSPPFWQKSYRRLTCAYAVHPIHLRHLRRRSLRGPELAQRELAEAGNCLIGRLGLKMLRALTAVFCPGIAVMLMIPIDLFSFLSLVCSIFVAVPFSCSPRPDAMRVFVKYFNKQPSKCQPSLLGGAMGVWMMWFYLDKCVCVS